MPARCTACGTTVSKLIKHLQQSLDPRCQRLFATWNSELSDDSYKAEDVDWLSEDDNSSKQDVEDGPEHWDTIPADPNGDIFGDYASYSKADFGIEMEQEPDKDSEDEDSELEEGEVTIEEEHGLEPSRNIQSNGQPMVVAPDVDLEDTNQEAQSLRNEAEKVLSNEPKVVVKFGGQAGKILPSKNLAHRELYSQAIGMSDNMFAPFSSRLEWEIARWAKLRGPSSTAFTELMNIKGVSIVFHPYNL